MAAPSAFTPLAENEIRLLRIHHGSEENSLSCSLEKRNLETENGRPYTAISYPWGPPEDPHFTCHVEGIPFSIRQNAYNILKAMRKPDSDVFVWLDALCINQKDKTEKSAQVRLMYQVYRRAKETAIWLGEADELTEKAVQYANTLDVKKFVAEFRASRGSPLQTKSFILDELASHPDKAALVNGISRLFRAKWFSRVWIRQEAAVGGNPYVLRWPYYLTWQTLVALAFLFQPKFTMLWPDWAEFHHRDIEPTLLTILAIENHRIRTNPVWPNVLFLHVVQARPSLTEKPHDKVYAMSSLASDIYSVTDAVFLAPNYHLSFEEVYVDVARYFAGKGDVADLLLEQAGLVHQGLNSSLPSWVPDWRYKVLEKITALDEWRAGGGKYQVSTKVSSLTKKERLRLLKYQQGFCSILPLCVPLDRHRKQLAKEKEQLAMMESDFGSEKLFSQEKENLRIQERWLQVQESASRGAMVLEIMASMQDKISYLSPQPLSAKFLSDSPVASEILAIDNQNLEFLESLETDLYITSETLRQAYNATLIMSQDSEDKQASAELISSAEEWRTWLRTASGNRSKSLPPYQEAFENSFAITDYSFAYTETGYMAMVPTITQLGDHIVVIRGYRMPFVIRPVQEEWYMLVGMCYVHGMMTSNASLLIEEFDIRFENGKGHVRRPGGDVRANGLKYDAGRYVDVLETLGDRWIKLI